MSGMSSMQSGGSRPLRFSRGFEDILFSKPIIGAFSAIDDKNSMLSLASQDIVYSSGRIAQEYKRNKYGGHEQLISELSAALVWGFGVPLCKQLYDMAIPRLSNGKVLFPWMEMPLLPGALPKTVGNPVKSGAPSQGATEPFDRDEAQVLNERIVTSYFKDVSQLPLEGEKPPMQRPPVKESFGSERQKQHLLDLVSGNGRGASILEHYRLSNLLKLLLCTTLPMLALGTLIPLALHRMTPWLIKRDKEKQRQQSFSQSPQPSIPPSSNPSAASTRPTAALPQAMPLSLAHPSASPQPVALQAAAFSQPPHLAPNTPIASIAGAPVHPPITGGAAYTAPPATTHPLTPIAPPPGAASLPLAPGSAPPRFSSRIPVEHALKPLESALTTSGNATKPKTSGLLARLSPMIATFLANDTLSTLIFIDTPLSTGRVVTTRTPLEQREVAFREVCLILVLFWLQRAIQERIAKSFDTRFDAHSNIEIKALRNLYTKYAGHPPETFRNIHKNLNESLALIKNSHTNPESEKSLVESIRRYFSDHRDKTQGPNLIFDLAEASGKIHTLGRQGKKYVDGEGHGIHYIDLSRKIDTDGVRDLGAYLDHLSQRMTEGHSLKRMMMKNAGLKMAAFTLSAAACWGIVSYLVPKTQHYLTYLSTGKDEFPGIQGLETAAS